MDNLRIINIQGKYASAFWLKDKEAVDFRCMIEKLTGKPVAFISTRYRSDLLYEFEEDRSELIIRIWCTVKKLTFSSKVQDSFIRKHHKEDVLRFYFISLLHLTRHAEEFKSYSTQFSWLLRSEPQIEILRIIKDCNDVIMRKLKNKKDPSYLLSQLANSMNLITDKEKISFTNWDVFPKSALN